MPTIRKRRSRWQVQIRRKGYPPFTRSFLMRADAEAWGRQQEVALERGDIINVKRDLQALTLGQLLQRYLKEVTPLKRGAKEESARIGVVLRHAISEIALDRVSATSIASYRDDRLQFVTAPSVRRELSIIRHCFELARKTWGIQMQVNPAAQVIRPPSNPSRTRRLELHELPALEAALRKARNPLVRDVFDFALATGMRRGEILSLVWTNVNMANRTAYLPVTKNGDSRTVPLSLAALEVLSRRTQGKENVTRTATQSVDCSNRVFPISANGFRLAWERVKRRANVGDLRFHDLRHEAISRFFEKGLNVPEVALISGHRDPRMLFRYTHPRAEDVAQKL